MAAPEADEPWWSITRANAWLKLNIAAAVAVGVYLLFRADDFYSWLSDGPFYFATALVVLLVLSVPLVKWFRPRGHEIIGVWIILAVIVLAVATITALGDAREQRHYNCWTISKDEKDTETVACAPGSEPEQWSPSSEFDPGRVCDPLDESDPSSVTGRPQLSSGDTGVTFWACD